MGNQLVSSVKTVIKPIEHYLSDSPDIKLKSSLGQTQFLKVAHCVRGTEGEVVVKVLSHEDPSLLLEPYRNELLEFAKLTRSNSSIASFRIVEIRTNFAYIIRQYVRYSLYDRLSTRPFLTDIEKCWIVYQIFKCMSWCHEKRIYHGDIKLENILVTSNLWVMVTDFATYKPASLPEDNPSFFNYFFDTSRRRCCNIAPERFVPTANLSQMDNATPLQANMSSESLPSLVQEAQLTDKMDMFSIGCTLAEIFSDNVLFDLSNLLYYKENKLDRLEISLKKIKDETIRELVQNLISLEPSRRKSCDQILEELKGVLFPSYFDKLYKIMRILVRLSPDNKIQYLIQEVENYLPMIIEENPSGILILLMTITSSLRSLVHVHCKIEAQRLICYLVKAASPAISPFINDRLIPYLVHILSKESDHRIRGEAINSITDLLEQVVNVSKSDSRIFSDYLMEILIRSLENEKSVFVRLRMAQNVGRLSMIALKFLNQSCDQNYDIELKLLHGLFASLVVFLLTDTNSCVRRTLLLTPENCAHLCTFFGRQKTNDVILPHIFTFLNHKNDFQLRLSFFDNVIVIASYLGVQCSTILHPLLQQGLCDAEEIIIAKTINSIASLAEQGLLQKNIIYELLKEMLPLLYHPNYWIIHSIVYLFNILSDYLSIIDLHCKVLPMLTPFLHRNIHSLSNKYLVMDSLNPPIIRNVYDIVMETKDGQALDILFLILQNKISAISNVPYKRLVGENITPYTEGQLLKLSDLLGKIHRNRRNYLANQNREDCSNVIDHLNYKLFRSVNLWESSKEGTVTSSVGNQEWQHMFGPRTKHSGESASNETVVDAHEVKEVEYSYFDCPPCARDLKMLELHKKNSFNPCAVRPLVFHSSGSFKPKGLLISHLYEHRASVNQLAKHNANCFISCSDDGTLRCWDLSSFENRHVINRSKFMFKMEFSNGNPIHFGGVVSCGHYIVTYAHDGSVYVFESNETSIIPVCNFKVGCSKSSVPLFISSICALSDNMFAVSLTNSLIYGYDIRRIQSPNFFVPVFKVQTAPSQRTITSIDGCEIVLFAGTAGGYIAGFDLRFNLKVNSFSVNSNNQTPTRIAKVRYTPEGLYTSTHGSSDVTLWDYKLCQKNRHLRTFKRQSDKPSTVVNAILPISGNSRSSSAVLTAGTDMRIRYWDLYEPANSYIISDPSFKACSHIGTANSKSTQNQYFDHSVDTPPLATFNTKQVADHQVIEELDASNSYNHFKNSHFCALDQQSVPNGHQDSITDLLRVNQYLVSCGRSGTVKVWR